MPAYYFAEKYQQADNMIYRDDRVSPLKIQWQLLQHMQQNDDIQLIGPWKIWMKF